MHLYTVVWINTTLIGYMVLNEILIYGSPWNEIVHYLKSVCFKLACI